MSLHCSQLRFCWLLLGAMAWSAPAAQAQLVPDVTLGDESSSISTDQLVQGDLADVIQGGAARGSNLFHSFSEFNVNNGQRVYFANPAEIESILSRVTGNSPSEIFGTLGVDGPADLFLINPNGFVFGENAQLDIPGSFYGTTAEAVELGNSIFSATAPEQSQLLAVSPSVSFWNYLTENSGNIVNRGALAVEGDLVLAGNQLDLESQVAAVGNVSLLATDAIKIRDTAETPFIAFAGEDLLVQGNQQVDIIALSHPDSGLFSYGDMILRSADRIGGDAHYFSGGNFRVENLDGSGGELFSPIDPIIRAYGDVEIEQYFGSSLHIVAGGSVSIGSAIINAPEVGILGVDFLRENVELSDGTILEIDGGAQATLDVRAGVRPEAIGTLPGVSGINPTRDFISAINLSETPARADINVSFIGTTLGNRNSLVLLTNQNEPNAALLGGNIQVSREGLPESFQNLSSGFINLTNLDTSEGIGELEGDGGSIFFDSRDNITISNSSIFTQSSGDVGDVVMIADDKITLDGLDSNTSVGIYTDIVSSGQGTGGDIRIRAEGLEILNGFQIGSYVAGSGQGGNLIIDIGETLSIENGKFFPTDIPDNPPTIVDGMIFLSSQIATGIRIGGEGQSGDVQITAGRLEVTEGARITSDALGNGRAGDIKLDIREAVLLQGSDSAPKFLGGISSDVVGRSVEAQGGNIYIAADRLEASNGVDISTTTTGVGNAGNIELQIRGTARLQGTNPELGRSTNISSNVQFGAEGQAGDIRIAARNIEMLNGAELNASTFGTGNAGNIILDIQETARIAGVNPINENGSFIASSIATDGQGNGGNIQITADKLEVLNGGQLLTTTAGLGNAGNIILDVRDIIRVQGINALDINAVSSVASGIELGGEGHGGTIRIAANRLEVSGGAQINSTAEGIGNAGDIVIDTHDSIIFEGRDIRDNNATGAFTRADGSVGKGGDIQVFTGILKILDGAQFVSGTNNSDDAGDIFISADELDLTEATGIITATRGNGDAGDIALNIRGAVKIADISPNAFNNGLFSSAGGPGNGDGGNIIITAESLQVLGGAQLNASTFGPGNSGNVVLTIQETARFAGSNPRDGSPSGAASTIEAGALGRGGDISIIARNLEVLNGAQLSSGVAGIGDGGDVVLTIAETARFEGADDTGVLTTIQETGIGQGGNLRLSAADLFILDGAVVSSGSQGQGNSGSIILDIHNVIQARDGDVSTSAGSSAGGQIQVNAGNIFLFGNSDIRSFVGSGDNNGGNITITADVVVALDDSDILAFAADGRGGNVDLSRTAFFGQDFSLAPFGTDPRTLDGNNRVDINATGRLASGNILLPDVSFIQNTLTELPDNLVNPETLVSNSCIARSNDTASSFTLTGSDGLPSDSLQPSYSLSSVQPTTETTNLDQDAAVIEPHRVYQLSDGRLVMSRECNEMD